MSQVPNDSAEHLSAFMDGELSDAEARFLLRRLEHDEDLRAAWSRMQLASHCLRGQPWQPVDAELVSRVASGVAVAGPDRARPALLRWGIAASMVALAMAMAPGLLRQESTPERTIAEVPAPVADHLIPSPATADLVALRAPAAPPANGAPAETTGSSTQQPLVATVERSERASPLPLSTDEAEPPSEFPLVDTGEERRWPRSEVVGSSSDPAIEAYLVRHNQMLAEDGLGGFVPYVDVVANGQPAAAPEAAASTGGEKK